MDSETIANKVRLGTIVDNSPFTALYNPYWYLDQAIYSKVQSRGAGCAVLTSYC